MNEPITIFADAGFCPRHKIGTYAVWAKYNGVTVRKSGILKGPLFDNHVAELHALVNGVKIAISSFSPEPETVLIVQSDSTTAISYAHNHRKKAADVYTSARLFLRSLIEDNKIIVKYKHVKGHKGHRTPRNSVNTSCDYECTRQLKIAKALFFAAVANKSVDSLPFHATIAIEDRS